MNYIYFQPSFFLIMNAICSLAVRAPAVVPDMEDLARADAKPLAGKLKNDRVGLLDAYLRAAGATPTSGRRPRYML